MKSNARIVKIKSPGCSTFNEKLERGWIKPGAHVVAVSKIDKNSNILVMCETGEFFEVSALACEFVDFDEDFFSNLLNDFRDFMCPACDQQVKLLVCKQQHTGEQHEQESFDSL